MIFALLLIVTTMLLVSALVSATRQGRGYRPGGRRRLSDALDQRPGAVRLPGAHRGQWRYLPLRLGGGDNPRRKDEAAQQG
jgi:hypothetical protein